MKTVHGAIDIKRLQRALARRPTAMHARTNLALATTTLNCLTPRRPIRAALHLVCCTALSEMTTRGTIMRYPHQLHAQRCRNNHL
jgi:hypothetical protein